jgi:signal transduction histidine kinase
MPIPMHDSRQRLAASIERSLRSHMPAGASREDLAAAIERTLLAEARRSELTLARLRAATALAFTVLYLGAHFWPSAAGLRTFPAAAALFTGLWTIGAGLLLRTLRRGWYRPWVRHVLPAADGVVVLIIFLLFYGRIRPTGEAAPAAALINVTALCVFLAFSGALRLTHSAAKLTTVIAVGVFLFAASLFRLHPIHVAFVSTTLVVTGLLAAGVTNIVRRVVLGEVGRLTLERLYAEAEQAILAREEILSVVSHDLRNPLSTISMSASLMLEMPLAEEQRVRQLNMIRRAGERMNRLIQDLLNAAQIEAGRLSIETRPTDVASLMAETAETLGPVATERLCRLEADIERNLPNALADPARILQVLANLVGNAIKFTPAGGRIVVGAKRVRDKVLCSVGDSGPGIPEEQLPYIFDRFWQAKRTDRRGIGLGLAIAKGIIEAHGQTVWAVSTVGVGSTFYFTLPLADVEAVRTAGRTTALRDEAHAVR